MSNHFHYRDEEEGATELVPIRQSEDVEGSCAALGHVLMEEERQGFQQGEEGGARRVEAAGEPGERRMRWAARWQRARARGGRRVGEEGVGGGERRVGEEGGTSAVACGRGGQWRACGRGSVEWSGRGGLRVFTRTRLCHVAFYAVRQEPLPCTTTRCRAPMHGREALP
jgi:hypothetical protein